MTADHRSRPLKSSRDDPRPPARRVLREGLGDTSGAAAVEFALTVPVLVLILLSIIQFAFVLNNYVQVSNAARATVRQVALSRPSGATATTPWANAVTALTTSAPTLTAANITMTIKVNGTTCGAAHNATASSSNDSACSTALTNQGGGATSVTLSYPCSLTFFTFSHACSLSATTQEIIE